MYGIIGALDEEVEALIAALENKKEDKVGPYTMAQGVLEGKNVVICRSGIGKVAAGNCAAIMIERYQVNALINTGAAGGLVPGMKIGDTAFCTAAIQHDFDLTVFNYKLGQIPGHGPEIKADEALMAKARLAAEKAGLNKPFEGLILSGDQFISSDAKTAFFKEQFPGCVAVEMEGAAIAQTAEDFKVPFLVIRAISDCADNEGAVSYDEFSKQASVKSAALVRALLTELD